MNIREQERPWKQFEDVVVSLLRAIGFVVTAHSPQGDAGYDFDAKAREVSWAIEVKYYRSARAQIGLIEAAAARVSNNGLNQKVGQAALVVSAFITQEQRRALERKYAVTFVDRADLEAMASAHPGIADQLSSILEARSDLSDQPSVQTGVLDRFERGNGAPKQESIVRKGFGLGLKLQKIRAGRTESRKYEKTCVDILKYLFGADLVGWKEQSRTDDKLNRFDCVCRAKPTHEFWRFVIEDLGSRYVLFEFKNYSEAISQGEVLTTEKYLLGPALRKVAFILARNGGDEGALKMAKGAMREHGKLMLILDDGCVGEMLKHRDRGVDPTDVLFDKADEFLLTLSR